MTLSLTSFLFTFFSRYHARASFWRFQQMFSKQLGCKTYFNSLSYSLCKNLYKTRCLGPLSTKKSMMFFQKDWQQFSYGLGKRYHFRIFEIFLLIFCLFCIQSNVKRQQQNIPCSNQNIDKNHEKLQFGPRNTGTL